MNIIFKIILALFYVSLSFQWNYNTNGKDWMMGSCNPNIFKEQSPINIETSQVQHNISNILYIKTRNVDIQDQLKEMDQTLKTNGYYMRLMGGDSEGHLRTYESEQLHFHSPGEHTVNSKTYPLEMHVVNFETPKSRFYNPYNKRIAAAFGIFFEVDDTKKNPFWDVFDLEKLNTRATYNFHKALFNTLKQMEQKKTLEFYYYPGGLTTPDCNEIVQFYLLKEPLTITTNQLKVFQDLWINNKKFSNGKGNNRILMDLNDRVVKSGIVSIEELTVSMLSGYMLSGVFSLIILLYFLFE